MDREKYISRMVRGPLETAQWWVMRFIHVTCLLRWTFDPDKYDFLSRCLNIGVFRNGQLPILNLVGGVRTIPPRSLKETVTFGESCFRTMVNEQQDDVWPILQENIDLVLEATRFLVSYVHPGLRECERKQIIDRICMGLYHESARLGRPFILVTTNSFLYRLFTKYNFTFKVVGLGWFNSKNKWEKQRYGPYVPHFVMILNLAESEQSVSPKLLKVFMAGMDVEKIKPFTTRPDEDLRRYAQVWTQIEAVPEKELSEFLEAAKVLRSIAERINGGKKQEALTGAAS